LLVRLIQGQYQPEDSRQDQEKQEYPVGYLSEIERNEKTPGFDYMILIAKALDVKLEDLYKEIR
jgi:transcriptional regulator with XRE-family HTH domain